MADTLQYTLRGIPVAVDRILRRRAKESGKSFNRVAVEALIQGTGSGTQSHDDLDFMIGTMSEKVANEIDEAIDAQRQVDDELWR